MIWSYSNLKAFEDCPYSWYMKYIECEVEKRGNVYSQFGTLCHSILERYLKHEITREQLLSTYEREFYDYVTEIILDKNDPTEKLYKYGEEYFRQCNIVVEHMKPIYVEKEIRFKVGDYDFRGIIDCMFKDKNGNLIVLDHKTSDFPIGKNGSVKKSKQSMMDGYTKQLALYAHGVQKTIGVRPHYICWNFIRANKFHKVELTDKMINDTLAWVGSTIKSIYDCDVFEKKESYIMCKTLCDLRGKC